MNDLLRSRGQSHAPVFLTTFIRELILTPFLLLVPVFAFAATSLEGLEFKHGIAFYHELKYPECFTHLDYLNPDAPKGGR